VYAASLPRGWLQSIGRGTPSRTTGPDSPCSFETLLDAGGLELNQKLQHRCVLAALGAAIHQPLQPPEPTVAEVDALAAKLPATWLATAAT